MGHGGLRRFPRLSKDTSFENEVVTIITIQTLIVSFKIIVMEHSTLIEDREDKQKVKYGPNYNTLCHKGMTLIGGDMHSAHFTVA